MAATQIEPKGPVVSEAGAVNGRARGEKAPGHRLARAMEPMGGTRIVSAALGGLIATALWIGMFTVGLSVPSQPFRDGLLGLAGSPAPGAFPVNGAWDAMYALFIIAFSYTPTNLAMLCCLAALVGCLAYTATSQFTMPARSAGEQLLVSTDAAASKLHAANGHGQGEDTAAIPLRPTISAITWGFFIYLFIISGTLLAVQNPFASTTPDQYLRLAGTASLLAFVVGWRPELITRLVSQVGESRMGAQGDVGAKK